MGFGNIGIGELMMLMLVVLVVFGPKRMPEIARNMGKFIRNFQRETSAALKELKEGIEPVKVGVFDEPDSAKDPNGARGVAAAKAAVAASAAGGASAAPIIAPAPAQPNGRRTVKPRAKSAPKSAATAKRPSGAARSKSAKTSARSTARATAKRTPAKKASSARSRASRTR